MRLMSHRYHNIKKTWHVLTNMKLNKTKEVLKEDKIKNKETIHFHRSTFWENIFPLSIKKKKSRFFFVFRFYEFIFFDLAKLFCDPFK